MPVTAAQTIRTSRSAPYRRLVERGLITMERIRSAAGQAHRERSDFETLLVTAFGVPAHELGQALSEYYKTPFAAFDARLKIDRALADPASAQYFRRVLAVPLKQSGEHVEILCRDPRDPQLAQDFRQLYPGCEPRFFVGLVRDIERYIESLGAAAEEAQAAEPSLELAEAKAADEVDEKDGVVVKLAQQLIVDAWKAGASDIHFEPYPDKDAIVRLRVSGDCTVHEKVPRRYARALTSRLKLMAQLDISERRRPQDGKLSVRFGAQRIDLRVATIPTAGGMEDVVMRILPTGEPIPLENLIFSERNLREVHYLLQQPHGIFLCVGPTGSGKTTTLHGCLYFLNGPDIKIWTAEDPVEITQFGLRQVQVHPKIGLTFAAALRSFLRADPDVIMVGEMRDRETADTAVEASLTGHLVLSTLHTNSAVETNVRLLDMGIDPFNFADALLGVLAQRLVRRLCKACRAPGKASDQALDELMRHYGREALEKDAPAALKAGILYKPVGCARCVNTGYAGRIGIHELFVATESVKQLIQSRAPSHALLEAARAGGMRTLLQDGILKCFSGETDYAQVRAAVR